MTAAATRLSAERTSTATFATSDIDAELASGRRYDIASASSLVVVTPDPAHTIDRLTALTAPGGTVLIIDASPVMTRRRAIKLVLTRGLGPGAHMLVLWAATQSGRALPDITFVRPDRRTV
jgi:hypothetical protein